MILMNDYELKWKNSKMNAEIIIHREWWIKNFYLIKNENFLFHEYKYILNHILFLFFAGDKPHSCKHCHKRFALACNLRAHLKTHEGKFYFAKISHFILFYINFRYIENLRFLKRLLLSNN